MAAKKFVHPLQLIVALSQRGEEGVKAAPLAVRRLDGSLVRWQPHLEFLGEGELRVLSEAIRGAMHDQDRHVELRGAIAASDYLADDLIAANCRALRLGLRQSSTDASDTSYLCEVLAVEVTGRVAHAKVREPEAHSVVIDYSTCYIGGTHGRSPASCGMPS
jgi:hypothetical protein